MNKLEMKTVTDAFFVAGDRKTRLLAEWEEALLLLDMERPDTVQRALAAAGAAQSAQQEYDMARVAYLNAEYADEPRRAVPAAPPIPVTVDSLRDRKATMVMARYITEWLAGNDLRIRLACLDAKREYDIDAVPEIRVAMSGVAAKLRVCALGV